MKRVYFFLAILGGLLSISGCSDLPVKLNELTGTPKQFLSRQIIVTLSEDRRNEWQRINQEILDRFDVQMEGEFPLTSIRVNCLVYRVSELVDIDEVMRRLRADSRIELVQTNQVFAGLQGRTSNAHDASSYGMLSYGPKIIHADLAHHTVTGKGVSVAVVDTGADKDHPDLQGRVAVTENFVQGGNASFADDLHGTAVAGVIAARTDDGSGIDGIAPDAKIDIFKACWYTDKSNGKALCSSWTLAKALDAAIKSDSRIINLSLGGPDDALLKKLLVTADQHHIVLVAAALENSPEPGFPASLDFVIPVISADLNGDTTHPSWTTQQAVIAAPGIEILTTAPHQGYDFLSGSSLAAAHVSGVVALMLQRQPKLDPAEVRSLLQQTGRMKAASPNQTRQSFVMVDACRAVAALGATLDCP